MARISHTADDDDDEEGEGTDEDRVRAAARDAAHDPAGPDFAAGWDAGAAGRDRDALQASEWLRGWDERDATD